MTFHVESRIMMLGPDGNDKSELRLGKIHLVDLAGSERLSMSGAEGETMVETQNINLSLSALGIHIIKKHAVAQSLNTNYFLFFKILGNVLSVLSKNASILQRQQKLQSRPHESAASHDWQDKLPPTLSTVRYRDSKLTHLLKDSLGGNSKTIMITNIRTGNDYYQQTAISLMYASRAKKVRNHSSVNRNVIGDTGIHAVNIEIERLK